MYQPQPQQQPSTTMYLQPTGPGPVQPGVAYIISPVSTKCESYAHYQSMIAGIILIITGTLAFIFNIIGLVATYEIFAFIGHGFWCGVMFIMAGAFGVAAARKNRCMIITFMVLAIIAACLAAVMFALSVPSIIIERRYSYTYYGRPYGYGYRIGIMSILMAITSVVAGGVAIWGSVLACKVTCCGRSTNTDVVGVNQPTVVYAQQPQPQFITMTTTNTGAPPAYVASPPSAAFGGYPPAVMTQQLPQPPQQQELPGVHSQPVAENEDNNQHDQQLIKMR